MGDAREAEKNGLYADMAKKRDMEFGAIVLYTYRYGGFHSSALTFINGMAKAVDPATCLMSPSRWKQELMENIAIAVQRRNADIMISAAQRQRDTVWVRRRRPSTVPRHSSRSSGRGRRGVRGGGGTSGEQRQLLRDSGRAMACVARMIGLSNTESDDACRRLGCDAAESVADTEVEDEDVSPSSPSFIPETPLRKADGQRREEEVSASQREEKADRDANVCSDVLDGPVMVRSSALRSIPVR